MTMKNDKAWIGDLLGGPLMSRKVESSLSSCLPLPMNKLARADRGS